MPAFGKHPTRNTASKTAAKLAHKRAQLKRLKKQQQQTRK